jgi:outer membrane protein insertion porin family
MSCALAESLWVGNGRERPAVYNECMLFIVMALLLWTSPAAAQKRPVRKPAPPAAKPAAQTAWPIESISITGNREYSREQILEAAGLRIGQVVAPKDVEAAQKRLLAAGVFDEVAVKFGPGAGGQGYAVTFELTEAGPLFPVRFEDLPASREELTKLLRQSDPFFGPKIPATESIVSRYARVIEDYIAGKEKVVGKLAADDAGQVAVVFRSATPLPAISRVRFAGNEVLPASALENAINAVAVGLPYSEKRFRQLLDANVRPLYEARGRVRVSFPEIQPEKDKDVSGIVLSVKITEGPSYSLGEFSVDGTGVPSAELFKAANLKKGDLFNIEQIQAAVGRIEKRVRRDGFMAVKSSMERKVNDEAKTVDLTVHLTEGPRYFFGRLSVQGLDLISEPAIRKMWGIKPGDPFNAEYPDYFLNRVREDGVLDNLGETKAIINTDEAQKTVDVTLIFGGEAKPAPKRSSPFGSR